MSEQTPEQAEAKLAEKLVKPIEELSTFSVGVVAEAAETIAKAKAEAAVKALEAAQAAMARVAALKAGQQAATAAATKTPTTAATSNAPAAPAVAPLASIKAAALPEVPAPPAEKKPSATPETTPAIRSMQTPAPAAEAIERRSEPARRSEQERRETVLPSEGTSEDTPERRADVRRMSLGRRADDPSGVHRLVDSVRSASQAKSADFVAMKHVTAPKVPGRVLEPVAHRAGLHAPRNNAGKRKIVTPKLLMLFALMVLFGMYATGNLPQFDEWTDSVVNSAHAHNDQIVNGMVSGWHIAAYAVAALALLFIVFLIVNSIRSQSSDDL